MEIFKLLCNFIPFTNVRVRARQRERENYFNFYYTMQRKKIFLYAVCVHICSHFCCFVFNLNYNYRISFASFFKHIFFFKMVAKSNNDNKKVHIRSKD